MSYRKFSVSADFDGVWGSYAVSAHSHKEAIQNTLHSLLVAPDSIESIDDTTGEKIRFIDGRYEYVKDIPRSKPPKLKIGDHIDVDFSERGLKCAWRGYKIEAYELMVNQDQEVLSLKLVLRSRASCDT